MEVAMLNKTGRPLSRTQTVRLLIALTILAWATQTLFKQWGFGAEISSAIPATKQAPVDSGDAEKFVPAVQLYPTGATLALRSEATVIGGEVKLRQICRWSDADKTFFEPIGDLILVRLGAKPPFKSISLPEIRQILRDAGVNTASINFAGAASCTVARSDVQYNETDGLQKWIEAKEAARNVGSLSASAAVASSTESSTKPTVAAAPATTPAETTAVKTLRSALVQDIATRLNVPEESLQVTFKATDDKVLNISEPLFKFSFDPLRPKSLGSVGWTVTIISGSEVGSAAKKVTINADARIWQEQVVAARPMGFRQVIRKEDVIKRRTLVDEMSEDPLLTVDQIVGQQTAREVKPGMLMTAKMIDPVELVKTGQYVTITLSQGTVQVKTVARAMESGSYGQTIRVKNEATKDVFQVVVTDRQTATMNLAAPIASAPQN
jgi:flagella basal body P-ring formation protein FlgA